MTLTRPPMMTEWDRTLMAWHEAGHAVCALYSPDQEKIERISIVPDDEAFGIMKTQLRQRRNMTHDSMIGNITVALGGRIAEELFQHETTSSCLYDLLNARNLAIRMVGTFGMGKRTGLLVCCEPNKEEWLLLCEEQKKKIYLDINDILMEAQKNAVAILQEHSDTVEKLALRLLEVGTLQREELETMLK